MLDSDPGSGPPLRVLVVDPDDRVRESLTGILGICGGLVVVGDAGQVGPALTLAEAAEPDVILVDPRLPEVDAGLAFIGRLRRRLPATRVLVMSWTDGLEHAALAERADGFVRKTFRPSELVAAIEAAVRRPT